MSSLLPYLITGIITGFMMHTRGGGGMEELRADWTHTLGRHFVAVQLFGSSEAATAARS